MVYKIDPTMDTNRQVREANELLNSLFPICRSITGEGVRQTLRILDEYSPLQIQAIPSGTQVYDWVIPDEWNIHDAFVADTTGKRIIDFQKSNIHVVNYSIPIDAMLSFEDLQPHLYTLPGLPDAIPYRTSYYKRDWGFCLSQNQYNTLDVKSKYHVKIDAQLNPGVLNYAEALIVGSSGREILISTYCCHPSLANDNISGQILWILLLKELRQKKTRHSYRFINVPETIGAITYLNRNEDAMKKIFGAFILTTVGGPGDFGYKRTFLENHTIDRVVELTFRELKTPFKNYPFDILGSDESNFSMPFFRIPCGTICKDKYYEYSYYHTSLDDRNFVNAGAIVETLKLYLNTIEKLEMNIAYQSLTPYSQPMLGKRGLYPQLGGTIRQRTDDAKNVETDELDAILWNLFWADGKTSLLDVAEKTKIPMKQLYEVAEKLVSLGLLERII